MDDQLVCVLCGRPWPMFQNACDCGGFCSWGPAKDAAPDSWIVNPDGSWTPRPVPESIKPETDE